MRGRDPVASVDSSREPHELEEGRDAQASIAFDKQVGLRPTGVIAAEPNRGSQRPLGGADDVRGRVTCSPEGHTGGGCGSSDTGAKPFCGFRGTHFDRARKHDRKPPVTELRDEIELTGRADELPERIRGASPGHAQQHEREGLGRTGARRPRAGGAGRAGEARRRRRSPDRASPTPAQP